MTEQQIEEVVQMRLAGHSFSEIGRIFGRDHTTIMYHCKNSKITSKRTVIKLSVARFRLLPKNHSSYEIDGEKINPGKDYVDYLEEEKNRNWKKRTDIANSVLD